tara:strand:- start:665 stop:1327 length:663 start_codon:yes stop_codon:yes gene_type:complete
MSFLHTLDKKMSRRRLNNFIERDINNFKKVKEPKILFVGSGGELQDYVRNFSSYLYSIDIDPSRKPDQIIDLTDPNFCQNYNGDKVNLVCIFEVLEHTKNPLLAIKNIYNLIEKGSVVLLSTPFIFNIHDEPNDFYRFTKYGLKEIFKEFSEVEIKEKNGWLESIFVIIMRIKKSKSFLNKILGNSFMLFYYFLYPLIWIIQIIFRTKSLTTGYYLKAIK